MRFCWGAAIAVAATVVAVPASAAGYIFNFAPARDQSVRYDRGIAYVESAQLATKITVANAVDQDAKFVSVALVIANHGAKPFNFGPDNVTIRPNGMQPITLTTYEEAIRAEQKKQGREKFWSGLAAFGRAMSAADAGNTYSSGIYSSTANGFVDGNQFVAQANGLYSGTQYNSGAALAAQRNAREMNAADRADLEAKWAYRSNLNNYLLRTTTVDPGAFYASIVKFPISRDLKKSRYPVSMEIEINVVGEQHVFLGKFFKSD